MTTDENQIVMNIDDKIKNPKTKEITIVGWALDLSTRMIPKIKVSAKEAVVQLTHRADVNELYQLVPYGSVGFVITFNLRETNGKKIDILFEGEHSSLTESVDLMLNVRNPNAGKTKAMLKQKLLRVKKGLGYIKRNGLINTYRRLKIDQKKSNDLYLEWIQKNEKSLVEEADANQIFDYKPKISIVMPVYNVPEIWLRKSIESVCKQNYTNWELCICDDASTDVQIKKVLEEYASKDQRIKVVFHKENTHICGATNSALKLATGEFIALLDNDDELALNALYEIVARLNTNSEYDLLYSDEDKINEQGMRMDPAFKPDWSPDLLMGTNYISHLGVYRRSIIEQIGGFREGFEGAQDYDLVLRFVEQTESKRIGHIAKILYHWRVLPSSTASEQSSKEYAFTAGRKALQEALARRENEGQVFDGPAKGFYDVQYEIKHKEKVTVIIPTRNGYKDVKKCVDSIIDKTSYPNYEIMIADNGSDDPKMKELYAAYQEKLDNKFIVESIDIPFNYAKINNIAAEKATGTYLLFLNNDTEVIAPDWMTRMVSFAQFDRIGAVGAKLYYENNTIQHAGVVVGLGGLAGHVHHTFPKGDFGYFGKLIVNVNYLAITAACLMTKKTDFEKVSGFDEKLVVAYNDVDLCLKIYASGKDNVWLHGAELYHYESQSRGYEDTPEKQTRFLKEAQYFASKWPKYIENDPYYNPNLTRKAGDFSINLD